MARIARDDPPDPAAPQPDEGTEPILPLLRQADRAGTPRPPPSLDRDAPPLSKLYGPEELVQDLARPLLSLARLPTWPKGPQEGHGWGKELDDLLGGGVSAPYVLSVGSATPGIGKTAWLMQIADGLALRSAILARGKGDDPLTPVLLVSDTPPASLLYRSLARWTGLRASTFRAGRSAGDEAPRAREAAVQILIGLAGQARREWQRFYARDVTGPDLVDDLDTLIEGWREEIAARYPGRPVWPVVVVDPLQRFAGHRPSEPEAAHALAVGLESRARERRWIALLSADAARSGAGEAAPSKDPARALLSEAQAAFRTAATLLHVSDAVLCLRRAAGRSGDVQVAVLKNAWGPAATVVGEERAGVSYRFDAERMRFKPAGFTSDEPAGR